MCTENAGAGQLISREDCIFLIIDAQEKLMPVIYEKEKVTANIARLAQFCKITSIPVIVTEQQKLGSTLQDVKMHLTDHAAVEKIHFGCFACDGFEERIMESERKTLVLTGVEAHICVMQTALQAMTNYNVHIIADAVSSRTIENRDAALQRMRDAGATISTTEMFIYEVLQKAGTDEFKAVLPLVK